MLTERTIDDLVDTLQRAKKNGVGCTLLIGAGCSVTAGIPTAEGFVKLIENDYPVPYQRAANKTYFDCMAQLSRGERKGLIASYINEARLNWAHISIAQLMKHEFVDRVLTTNFDPLVVRSCALLNLFPAVYDVTASENFNPALISDPSIFYLHGQHTGFVLINTPSEFEENAKRIAPVFQEAVKGRVWIVVGYSGDKDPVFERLANVDRFDYGLYWVSYLDRPPLQDVRERLLEADKDGFYIKGYDADDFLVKLAHGLNCFPPHFVSRPFSYLNDLLAPLTSYSLPTDIKIPLAFGVDDSQGDNPSVSEAFSPTTTGVSSVLDVMGPAKQMIQKAVNEIEGGGMLAEQQPMSEEDIAIERNALSLLMAGEYDKVITLRPEYEKNPRPQLSSHIAWAYVMQGIAIAEQAKETTGEAADDLLTQAYEKFQAALAIKPDMKEALNNCGVTLYLQAENKTRAEADRLFDLAYDYLSRALQVDPYADDSLKNWGDALSSQAEKRSDPEADLLFEKAYQKYQESVEISPNQPETFFSWGNAFFRQAKNKSGGQAYELCGLAVSRYETAVQIDPKFHKAWLNMGVVLSHMAEMREGQESERLFRLTYEAYEAALRAKPDKFEALENWGSAISKHAKKKTGDEADKLYEWAYQIYTKALEVSEDKPRVFDHWGIILTEQAQTKSGDTADHLFSQAYEKFAQALVIKPNFHDAFYSWGVALFRQAGTKQGAVADDLYSQCYEKLEAALAIRPDLHGAMFNWGSAALEQAQAKSYEDADKLYSVANEKFKAALEIKPDMYEAVSMLGTSYFEQAKRKTGSEADELFALAYGRFEEALTLKPDSTNVLSNWGTALATQAKIKEGEVGDDLYAKAYEKFQRAVEINPALHETLNNWGGALLEQAKKKTGDIADKLYEQACARFRDAINVRTDYYPAHQNYGSTRLLQAGNRETGDISNLLIEAEDALLKAESLMPGSGAYNLSCVYARMGNETECRRWLERASAIGKLSTKEHMTVDPDLDNVRESQWFKDFLEKL